MRRVLPEHKPATALARLRLTGDGGGTRGDDRPIPWQPVVKVGIQGSTRRVACSTLAGMAMGTTRDDGSQQSMWVATTDLPRNAGHPFYERLNRILSAAGFDAFVEGLCARFYTTMGRPSLAPGRYFRLLLLGVLRGAGLGTGDRVAGGRFAEPACVSELGSACGASGPFDDLADAAAVSGRDASGGVHVGVAAVDCYADIGITIIGLNRFAVDAESTRRL